MLTALSRRVWRQERAGLLPPGSYRSMLVPELVLPVLAGVALVLFATLAQAGVPPEALRYQRDLIRVAHAEWGLDAPVATFAAQVHQESRWDPDARSPVGAEGLAQFMPPTSDWFAGLYPRKLGERQPYNPAWALRALVIYDLWLFKRIRARGPCDRWAMVLSAYNGGLGWVLRDKQLASTKGADPLAWFGHVERFNAGRSASAFEENRNYPRLILLQWERLYIHAGWGQGVCT